MTPSLLPMSSPPVVAVQPPRLLDQVAQAVRQRGASHPPTAQLVSFVRAFALFHGKCHPRELGLPAVTRFLEHIVRTEKQPLPALERRDRPWSCSTDLCSVSTWASYPVPSRPGSWIR